MGFGKSAVGFCAVDVIDVQTGVSWPRGVDLDRVHSLGKGAFDLAVLLVGPLLFLVSPVVGRVQRIYSSFGFENSVLVNVLDFQIGIGFDQFRQLRGLAPSDRFPQYFPSSVSNRCFSLPIYVFYF